MFNKQKNLMLLILFTLSFVFALPMQAFGFAEDICYFYKDSDKKKDVLPVAVNCFDLQCMDGVAGGSQSAVKCTVKGLLKYGMSAGLGKVHGRNSLHFDVTWMAGRLMGLTASDALNLALFSQGADLGTYQHIDKNGKVIQGAKSDNLEGVLRTNFETPGLWLHFVPRYMGTKSTLIPSELKYNKNNTKKPYDLTERPLDQVRKWAFGWHLKPCIFGLADANGKCLSSEKKLTFNIDLFIGGAPLDGTYNLGAQSVRNIRQREFDHNGEEIPPLYTDGSGYKGTVKALGIYLHMMGDRISHTQCSAPTGIKKEANGNFTLNYAKSCGQVLHIGLHYRETAHAPVPKRTKQGVELILREVKAWIKEKGNYQKDPASPTAINITNMVERTATALSESCASKRLEALCNISKSYGLGWHDGNSNCSFDHHLCNESASSQTTNNKVTKEPNTISNAGVGCNQVSSPATPSVFWLFGLFSILSFGAVRRRLRK